MRPWIDKKCRSAHNTSCKLNVNLQEIINKNSAKQMGIHCRLAHSVDSNVIILERDLFIVSAYS